MESQWPLVEKKKKKKKRKGFYLVNISKKNFRPKKKKTPAFSDQSINDT